MKKRIYLAAALFVLGMCLATGVEQNIWLALFVVPCMGMSAYLFNTTD